jgi:hypothetical protein
VRHYIVNVRLRVLVYYLVSVVFLINQIENTYSEERYAKGYFSLKIIIAVEGN